MYCTSGYYSTPLKVQCALAFLSSSMGEYGAVSITLVETVPNGAGHQYASYKEVCTKCHLITSKGKTVNTYFGWPHSRGAEKNNDQSSCLKNEKWKLVKEVHILHTFSLLHLAQCCLKCLTDCQNEEWMNAWLPMRCFFILLASYLKPQNKTIIFHHLLTLRSVESPLFMSNQYTVQLQWPVLLEL